MAWSRGLLVSVQDAAEASEAVAAGAAIIDVKQPSHGPLGRAAPSVTAAILAAVGGRAPVTLACGELAEGVEGIVDHVARVLGERPDVVIPAAVKAGPAGLTLAAWEESFARLGRRLPAGIDGVAVAYADWRRADAPPPEAILTAAARGAAATLLIDTFDKEGPGLFDTVGRETLADWVARAARGGMSLALAGRLDAAAVQAGFALGAAVCGVRGAACEGGRHGRVTGPRVRGLVTISESRPGRAAAAPPGRR